MKVAAFVVIYLNSMREKSQNKKSNPAVRTALVRNSNLYQEDQKN